MNDIIRLAKTKIDFQLKQQMLFESIETWPFLLYRGFIEKFEHE